jgi:hypothetical protein
MPLPANFSLDVVKDVFSKHGIHILETFPDGSIMWGNEPLKKPYKGAFHMADFYEPGRYDIFTIRGIISKLDKSRESKDIETELFSRINEGIE